MFLFYPLKQTTQHKFCTKINQLEKKKDSNQLFWG